MCGGGGGGGRGGCGGKRVDGAGMQFVTDAKAKLVFFKT